MKKKVISNLYLHKAWLHKFVTFLLEIFNIRRALHCKGSFETFNFKKFYSGSIYIYETIAICITVKGFVNEMHFDRGTGLLHFIAILKCW